ncbi:hypothetical protein Droror1_Dr00016304 [Drosera rotundifolia]
MCILRFILVFFSAALAGYFAWRSVRSSSEVEDVGTIITLDDSNQEMKEKGKVEEWGLKKGRDSSTLWATRRIYFGMNVPLESLTGKNCRIKGDALCGSQVSVDQ